MRNFTMIWGLLLFGIPAISQDYSSLRVEVEGLRNNEGKLSITFFNSPEGFPEDIRNAYQWRTLELSEKKPVFLFNDLPAGEYAYAILHDEDGNGEMKKNLLGIPREGFGFSNNYEPKIKNPSFKDASFYLRKGSKAHHKIEILYF
ncbi:MAG: DUF2141 domain-containing protein [Bacteroidota bacterium]